jgi:hypothetical protein
VRTLSNIDVLQVAPNCFSCAEIRFGLLFQIANEIELQQMRRLSVSFKPLNWGWGGVHVQEYASTAVGRMLGEIR